MPSAADDFLKAVMRSGLLNRTQLQSTLAGVPREQRDDPQSLADFLVKQDKLTRFQAFKLLQGAWFGLQLGPFQVQAPIGKGGMGAVYLAFDLRSHRHVALKVLPPKRAKEETRHLARFRREMEMSQRVRHPHIALTLEAGENQGVHYIVMEYIPGKSLHRTVSMEGPLPVPRAARLFAEVAAALDHAHAQGLIHRDLKPSNILITPNVHAKVLDLGLALREGEVGDAAVVGGQGYVVGSMDYIAPEQTEDASKVDARSDLYSMGCSLYYALTGRPPFPGGTNKDKIRRHRHEQPEPLLQLNPKVSEEFAYLVDKMLAKDPDRRFPSAAAAREVLLRWGGADYELPLDQPTDAAFQQAVTALTADVTADMAREAIVIPEAVETKPSPPAEGIGLIMSLIGFWAFLLLILMLVLAFRGC
jgi:serine/threonine protein kinase